MITVVVRDKPVTDILDIVKALKQQGLVIGKDFDFAYKPPEYDYMNGHTSPKQTQFTFYDEKLATWFSLKWS